MQLKKNSVSNKKDTSSVQKIDWLSWGILISAAVIVAFFVINNAENVSFEINLRESQNQALSDETLYRYNVQFGDSTPHKTYEQLRQTLLNNDLKGALDTIHPDYLWKYEDNLTAAHNDGNLSTFLERLTPLKEKIYDDEGGTVRYITVPIPGNDELSVLEGYTESVEFIRNRKGVWKISSI